MTSAILTYADQFALIAAEYTPSTGSLSEQYLKTTGAQTSAADLTWSYASVLTMCDARNRTTAETWGAGSLTLPSTCSSSSGGSGSTSTVTFKVTATTVWGGELSSMINTLFRSSNEMTLQKTSISPEALLHWKTGQLITPSALSITLAHIQSGLSPSPCPPTRHSSTSIFASTTAQSLGRATPTSHLLLQPLEVA